MRTINFRAKKLNNEEPTDEWVYGSLISDYGCEGHCYKLSGGGNGWHISISCTPDCGCARMKRYDTLLS